LNHREKMEAELSQLISRPRAFNYSFR